MPAASARIEAFLTPLAVEEHVAASTQNQALAALLFLHQQVLRLDLSGLAAVRARRSRVGRWCCLQGATGVRSPRDARRPLAAPAASDCLVEHG